MSIALEYPKVPRWISTEAGQWAWRELVDWRGSAGSALSVQDRSRLLQEAEALWSGVNSLAHHGEDHEQ